MADCRAAAASTLARVLQKGSAYDAASLPTKIQSADPRDIRLYKELCFGSLRQFYFLDALTGSYLKKSLNKKDSDVRALLVIGAYQLIFMRIPDHAALSSTVEACKTIKKVWAKGMVNAILRNIIKQLKSVDRDDFNAVSQACKERISSNAALHAHPDWLYQKIVRDYPEQATAIIEHNNDTPLMTLRFTDQTAIETTKQFLQEQGVTSAASPWCKLALTLEKPLDVTALPGFDKGETSVQDAGAQLATSLFDLEGKKDCDSINVLDACAAPGGKSLQLLQQYPQIKLTALDISEQRLTQVKQNLERGGKSATLKSADAADLKSWWNDIQFDAILLDAPCSGSGVINRHPDIKLLRRESDIASFSEQQKKLISELWKTLKVDGELVYCTCSIFKEENQAVIEWFTSTHKDATLCELSVPWGHDTGVGHQLLPNKGQNDGFFFAKIRKQSKTFDTKNET